jgi:hypothetical protein
LRKGVFSLVVRGPSWLSSTIWPTILPCNHFTYVVS